MRVDPEGRMEGEWGVPGIQWVARRSRLIVFLAFLALVFVKFYPDWVHGLVKAGIISPRTESALLKPIRDQQEKTARLERERLEALITSASAAEIDRDQAVKDEVRYYGDRKAAVVIGRALGSVGRHQYLVYDEIDALKNLPFDESYAALVREVAEGSDSSERIAAARALGEKGKAAAPVALKPLLESLGRKDPGQKDELDDQVAIETAKAISQMGEGAFEGLSQALRTGDDRARVGATVGLWVMKDPRVFDELLEALRREKTMAAYEMEWALVSLDQDRVTALAGGGERDARLRRRLVGALRNAPDGNAAVAALARIAADDPDASVRAEAKTGWQGRAPPP